MSNEHKKYLRKLKLNKLLISITQISIFIFFIIIWQFLASHNYINSFITSSPAKILSTISKLYIENNLFIHIWITVKETIKNIHEINLYNKSTPINNREAKEFKDYYKLIWKEIDNSE